MWGMRQQMGDLSVSVSLSVSSGRVLSFSSSARGMVNRFNEDTSMSRGDTLVEMSQPLVAQASPAHRILVHLAHVGP